MSINAEDVRKSAHTVSKAGAAMEHVAGAAGASHSTLGRIGMAITGVKLGAQLLPAGIRLFRQRPLATTLAVAGVIWAVYLLRRTPRARR